MTIVETAEPRERAASQDAVTKPADGTRLLALWLLAAVVVTLGAHLGAIRGPFTEKQAWVSAHFAMMAHSFQTQGVLGQGGVPIQNYPPLGADPDAYTHWPPLFPIVLSSVFSLFGESEAVARGLMLVILAANALAMMALMSACCGRRAGLLAVFAFLTMPAMDVYGRLVLHLHLAILFLLLALLGFVKATGADHDRIHRRWAAFGLASMVLAMLTSWEPILACAGLFAVGVCTRRRSQVVLALIYGAAGVAVVCGVIGLYCLSSPGLAADLWHTVLFRTGLTSYPAAELTLHTIVNDRQYAMSKAQTSVGGAFVLFTARLWLIGGQLGTIALGWLLAYGWTSRRSRGDGRLAVVFGGLLSAWVLWFTLMHNHACDHEYQMLLAVPAASFAMGVTGIALLDLIRSLAPSNARRAGLAVLAVVPAVLLLPHTLNARFAWQAPPEDKAQALIAFAQRIRQTTEPNDIILIASNSMVPVYYSHRHTIRGVADEALRRIEERLPHTFPGCIAYLALMGPEELAQFPDAARRYPRRVEEPELVLLEIPTQAEGQSSRRRSAVEDATVRGSLRPQSATGADQNPPPGGPKNR